MDKKNILTDLQRKVLQHFFSDDWFRRYFYLTGGTALAAFYLFHRYSEDLDFFTHQGDFVSLPQLFKSFEKKAGMKIEQIKKSPSFMRYLVDNSLKLDFVIDIEYRYGSPELIGEFMVDCEKNIAINKVGCILSRFDAKDYIDLYLLLSEKKYDIFELLDLAKNKDGGIEPFIWSSLISEVTRLNVFPKMIKTVTRDELCDFYVGLRNQILDRINPLKNS